MKKIFFIISLIFLSNVVFSQNVIDSRLQEILDQKGDEMIDINIIFKSQMDISRMKSRANTILDKKVRRNILVDELKIFSEEKQQEVLSLLQAEKRSNKVTNVRSYWLSNAISCTAKRDVIYLLAEHPDIESISYDEMIYMLPEDDQQANEITRRQLTNEDADLTDNIIMVNADKVWSMGYTGKGVIVAVIDSGVNYNHTDLSDHLWDGGAEFPYHGYNVIDGNNDPMDNNGHGTHCAGTICGDGTSGIHTGIAPDVTLMCIKALDDYGNGSASSINAAMEFAVEHHADILSMSLGFPNSSTANKTWLRNTCVNTLELGVIASVAAGNHGKNATPYMQVPNNVLIPGMCPPPWLHPDQEINSGDLSCVVCVGAIDYFENMYENGSIGPVTWTDTQFNDYPYNPAIGLIRPDICAPGVGIKSLDHNNNNSYNLKSGTSMATPCVAGVMALMLEKQNDLTPAEICMILETTAKKLTETKSNLFGSGLINALEAVSNINKGVMTFNGYTVNDSEYNNNGNINAGETVKLSINITNTSEETFNNIKVIMSCNDESIEITDAEAIINIESYEEMTLTDEFEFSVGNNIDYTTPLSFEFNFYNEYEEIISSFNALIYTSEYDLVFSSFVIRNDDNGNGILEAGETADLGILLNNIGNEFAFRVNGTLSSSSDLITINQNEASFSSIGTNSSGLAFFNVTTTDTAGDALNIPFELKTSDIYGIENEFSSNYINACKYIFTLEDKFKDGWDGAAVLVKYSNGQNTDTLTIVNGEYEMFNLTIPSNVEVTLEWISGEYDSECSFFVTNDKGETIYASPQFQDRNTFLFSWLNDCSCVNETIIMCESVQNLTSESHEEGIVLTWSDANIQQVISYEIYRGTSLICTTEDTTYVDTNVVEETEYVYSVRSIYEDCTGYFTDITAKYTPVMTNEISDIKASVYPNPSDNDFTISCENIINVTIYNIVGNKTMDSDVNSDKYIIRGLESGVYFVEIKTEKGNIVKRILKL